MKILFVCRHNRFRSKVAEAYFNKVCKNKKIIAKSSGVIPGLAPLGTSQVRTAKSLGIEIKGIPKATSIALLKNQDLVIIVADDLPKKVFNYSWLNDKVRIWGIPDVKTGGDIKGNIKIIRMITKKVDRLIGELEDKNGKS